jgi:hypothetical protein
MVVHSMNFGDEFSDFVANELIDSSSSDDDEDNFYFDVTNIVAETPLDKLIRHGSIIGHRTVNRERLLWHYLLYRDYFSENPIFNLGLFGWRLVCNLNLILIMLYSCVWVWLNNFILYTDFE